MTDRMISFLKHINIENFDDFDIDFEMVGRNRFRKEQIDMVIRKNSPWKYHLLRQFQDGLNTLTYQESNRSHQSATFSSPKASPLVQNHSMPPRKLRKKTAPDRDSGSRPRRPPCRHRLPACSRST